MVRAPLTGLSERMGAETPRAGIEMVATCPCTVGVKGTRVIGLVAGLGVLVVWTAMIFGGEAVDLGGL